MEAVQERDHLKQLPAKLENGCILNAINLALPLKILLAIDGSPHSAAAVNLLTRITWPTGTSVHVLAVVPDRLPLMERSSAIQNKVDEALEIVRWRDWAEATVIANEVAARLRVHKLIAETEVAEGLPTQVLLKRSEKLLTHLIVIGARGLSPPGKLQLGPTAHKLAHYANNSVLVARPSNQVRPLNTILAVDGSSEAWGAIEFLCTLSLPQWARVSVVNVDEKEPQAQTEEGPSDYQLPSMPQQLNSEATAGCIVKIVDHLHSCGVQVWPVSRVGDPAEEILAISQEQKADLIVIGVHSQPNAGIFHWQGVAQKVVKYAPCSVLAVRRERAGIYDSSRDLGADTTGQVSQRSATLGTVQTKVRV